MERFYLEILSISRKNETISKYKRLFENNICMSDNIVVK